MRVHACHRISRCENFRNSNNGYENCFHQDGTQVATERPLVIALSLLLQYNRTTLSVQTARTRIPCAS